MSFRQLIVPAILFLAPVAEAGAGPDCSKCGSAQANEKAADDWCDAIASKKATREAFANYRHNPSSPGIDGAATSEEAADAMREEVHRDTRVALGLEPQPGPAPGGGGGIGAGNTGSTTISMRVSDETCLIEGADDYERSVCAEWFAAALGHERYHQELCRKQKKAGTPERLRCDAETKGCESQYMSDRKIMEKILAASKRDKCLRQAKVRCDAREEEEGYAGEILDLNDRFLKFAKKCKVNAKCSLTNAETLDLMRIRDRSQKASSLLRRGGQ